MAIAAIIIGLITAYYFGIKPGGYAALVAAALFFVAALLPGLALPVYGLVVVALVGIFFLGPRVQRPSSSRKYFGLAGRVAKRWWRRL